MVWNGHGQPYIASFDANLISQLSQLAIRKFILICVTTSNGQWALIFSRSQGPNEGNQVVWFVFLK